MIFIDASAIVAVLTDEDESATLVEAIEASSERFTSPIAIFEATLGICRKRHTSVGKAYEDVLQFLTIAVVQNVAIAPAEAQRALDAFYAMAASCDAALLFNGNDFSKTDARLPTL